MKTLCVTGGNGLLGCKVLRCALGKYRCISIDLQEESIVRQPDLVYIRNDVRDRESLESVFFKFHPDAVIHTAAFTNVDGCETEREHAWSVNVRGAENVARACQIIGCKMIHISTDYVFDGREGPYSERDRPNPISYYAETKLESERIVEALLADYAIVRPMVLYGFHPAARMNFVTWVVEEISAGRRISVVDDQYGTPTLAEDLAGILMELIARDGRGLYHAAGSERLHRYDFALRIADVFGIDDSLIFPTTSRALNQRAPRPLQSGLKNEKICGEMKFTFTPLDEGLRLVRAQMKEAGCLPSQKRT